MSNLTTNIGYISDTFHIQWTWVFFQRNDKFRHHKRYIPKAGSFRCMRTVIYLGPRYVLGWLLVRFLYGGVVDPSLAKPLYICSFLLSSRMQFPSRALLCYRSPSHLPVLHCRRFWQTLRMLSPRFFFRTQQDRFVFLLMQQQVLFL